MKDERMIERILDQRQEFKKLADKLSDMALMISAGGAKNASLENLSHDALRMCEKQYLRLKGTACEIADGRDKTPFEIYGTASDFQVSIEKIGENRWKLHLPVFSPISPSRKKAGDGKYMYYLVYNLLDKYWKEHKEDGTLPKPLKDPVIIYEYHIRPDRNLVFDFDNVDSKSVLDAMQGFFITDDSAFSITTIQNAVRDDNSFTDIFILEKPDGFLR